MMKKMNNPTVMKNKHSRRNKPARNPNAANKPKPEKKVRIVTRNVVRESIIISIISLNNLAQHNY